MDNTVFDLVEIGIAAWLDSEEDSAKQAILHQLTQLKLAEAQCRRDKADALIKNMAQLQMALSKFEKSYESKKKKYGPLPYAEETIRQVRLQIKKLSLEKNRL